MTSPGTPNPYDPPGAPVDDIARDPDRASMTELRAFASGKYPEKWQRRHLGQGWFAGFNVWAFLFGTHWFIFRKLYLEGVLFFAFELGLPIAALKAVRGMSAPGDWEMQQALWPAACGVLAARLVGGVLANVLLHLRAVEVIRKVDALNLDTREHLALIAERGGVSFVALFVAYAALGVLPYLLG